MVLPTYLICTWNAYTQNAYTHTHTHLSYISKVKYFDKKRVYDEYKKKLESEGFQPLPLEEENTEKRKQ